MAEVQANSFRLAEAGGQEHAPIALACRLLFQFLKHAPRDALAAHPRQRPDALEFGGVGITVRHEGAARDRHTIAQQQHKRPYRRGKCLRRVALQFLAGAAADASAHIGVATVVFLLQAVEQRPRQRVIDRGIEEAFVVAHVASFTR